MFFLFFFSVSCEKLLIEKIVPNVIQSKSEKNISILFTPELSTEVFVSLDKSFLKCDSPLRGGVTCIIPAHESGVSIIEISTDKLIWSNEYKIRFIDFTLIWVSVFVIIGLISMISMIVSYITCKNNRNKYKDDDDDEYEPLVQRKQKTPSAAIPINRTHDLQI